jgi:hypothetical protein
MVALDTKAVLERKVKAHWELSFRAERGRQSNLDGGLIHFVRYFWPVLEPAEELIEGWALDAMCLHLEAVTRGEIKRLLINVPPGFMKSMLVNVFWPAWEWSAAKMPYMRYVAFSYAAYLTERDNAKFRDLVTSRLFVELWGGQLWGGQLILTTESVQDDPDGLSSFAVYARAAGLTGKGKIKVENSATGWKFASSVDGVGTGERGRRILLDDAHNVREGESEAVRTSTVTWVREGMSNRLNNIVRDVIIGIGQRVHEEDASSAMIEDGDYVHLMIPMEYDPQRHCKTEIGWEDPRSEDGELAWPERYPASAVAKLKRVVGPYAYSAQYQQSPEPRGGGIIKRAWWGSYELAIGAKPKHIPEFVVASLDPAFTAKQENDPSGFVICGIYRDDKRQPRILLMHAWKKWLELHGQTQDRRPQEATKEFLRRTQPGWGLVEQVAHDCTRLKVSLLLIEDKASGHSVAQEIRRLYSDRDWGVQLVNPGSLDKRARAFAVQHLFADGVIEAPFDENSGQFREWAELVIDECAKFRGLAGDEDNLVDALTQALKYLRDNGLIVRREEREFNETESARHRPKRDPLYPV